MPGAQARAHTFKPMLRVRAVQSLRAVYGAPVELSNVYTAQNSTVGKCVKSLISLKTQFDLNAMCI